MLKLLLPRSTRVMGRTRESRAWCVSGGMLTRGWAVFGVQIHPAYWLLP